MLKICKCGNKFTQYRTTQNKCAACLIKTKRNKLKEKLTAEKRKPKKLIQLINDARKPFQQWIRFRDKEKSCISCGANYSVVWDAGHYMKAELYSALIFEETNAHKQCRRCNFYLDGNEHEYRIGLIERFGATCVDELERKAEKQSVKRYEREELQKIKETYTLKLKNKEL